MADNTPLPADLDATFKALDPKSLFIRKELFEAEKDGVEILATTSLNGAIVYIEAKKGDQHKLFSCNLAKVATAIADSFEQVTE